MSLQNFREDVILNIGHIWTSRTLNHCKRMKFYTLRFAELCSNPALLLFFSETFIKYSPRKHLQRTWYVPGTTIGTGEKKGTAPTPRGAHILSSSFPIVEIQISHLKNKGYKPWIPVYTQKWYMKNMSSVERLQIIKISEVSRKETNKQCFFLSSWWEIWAQFATDLISALRMSDLSPVKYPKCLHICQTNKKKSKWILSSLG